MRFVDDDEGRTLNRTYRQKDYATNVLTFAYAESEDDPVTGDLILCCPVVEKEAREQGKPLAAHYAHLIVHGTLHAQGYDHEDRDGSGRNGIDRNRNHAARSVSPIPTCRFRLNCRRERRDARLSAA